MDLEFEPPLRLYHISGGLQMLAGSNRLTWLLTPHSNNPIFWSALRNPWDIIEFYPDLKLIGRNLFSHVDEMKETITPNFTLAATSKSNTCLAYAQHTFWSGVAHALAQDGSLEYSHICRRLSTQVIKSTRRLEKLSLAYRLALPNLAVSEEDSIAFHQNKYASNVGNEFGSLLDDLYGLRDAINVVVFRMLLKKDSVFSTGKLRKELPNSGASVTSDMIKAAMFDPASGDLIISRMSTYRAVALHCMGTSNPVTLDSLMVKCIEGPLGILARLVYPLYDDMAELKEIEAGRSFGIQRDKASFERFAKLDQHLDGMEFAYDCFVRLLEIAETLGSELAVVPRHLTLTSEDIIKATFTDKDGNQITLERDPVSGTLNERRI